MRPSTEGTIFSFRSRPEHADCTVPGVSFPFLTRPDQKPCSPSVGGQTYTGQHSTFPPTGGLEARTAKTNLRKPITSTFCPIEPFPITINQKQCARTCPLRWGCQWWGPMGIHGCSTAQHRLLAPIWNQRLQPAQWRGSLNLTFFPFDEPLTHHTESTFTPRHRTALCRLRAYKGLRFENHQVGGKN